MKRPARAPRAARPSLRALATETPHPRAAALDDLSTRDLVALLLDEERHAFTAAAAAGDDIARAADLFAAAIEGGGRVVYVGAGTSGRLAALDAAELPPTFGTDPRRVVALIAGGRRAIDRAVEGAEDRADDACRALARLRVGPRDLVVAIAASGVTPFTCAALDEARRRGARTAFVTCGEAGGSADVTIHASVGPEVVAGSTRLKAGTATKLVLNALSTAAMVRLGKVWRGRMVDLVASNAKLRARARRTVEELGGVSPRRAAALLAAAEGSVKLALAAALLGAPIAEARARLDEAGGRLDRLAIHRARRR